MRKILALTLAAALALAGCSRAAEAPSAPTAATSPAAELRLGYFPNITHAPALIGVANGFFAKELGSTKLTTQTFNAGPEEVSALLGGSLDAGLHRLQPGDQRVRQVQRRGRPAHRGLDVRRRPARRLARHHLARPAQGQDHRDAAAGQHAGRRAEEVAEGAQPRARHRSGQGHRPEPGQRPHARPVQDQAARGRLAAGAVELPAGRRGREGARRREDAVAERPVPHDRADRPHPVPAGAPGHDRRADPRRAAGDRLRRRERGRGQDGDQRPRSSSSPGPRWRPRCSTGRSPSSSSPSTRSPPPSRSSSKDSVTAGVADKETNLKGFIDVTALNGVLTQAGKPAVDAAGLDKAQG